MFRIFSNNVVKTVSHNYQQVRWFPRKPRKPLWMPTAKSKMFRIPVKPKLPPEEEEELKRLFNNYRNSMKSIKNYLTLRYSVKLQAKADTELERKAFEDDLARCKEINDKWNEEIRIQREKRVAEELEKEIAFAENRMKKILKSRVEKLQEAEEIVRREKEAVVGFVTPENLDEVIEKALNNPVDYNFAIDLDGNRIMGRETQPSPPKNEKIDVKQ